jgi:hypothetical protein
MPGFPSRAVDHQRGRALEHDHRVDPPRHVGGGVFERRAIVRGRRSGRIAAEQPEHLARVGCEQSRAGVPAAVRVVELRHRPQRVGVEDGRLRQFRPQRRDDLLDGVRPPEAGADRHRVRRPQPRGDLAEGVAGERAVVPCRQAPGHHARIEAGRDRRHRLRHEHFDEPRPAPQGGHGGEGRRPGHPGGTADDDDPAVVPFAGVAAATRQPRQIRWRRDGRRVG